MKTSHDRVYFRYRQTSPGHTLLTYEAFTHTIERNPIPNEIFRARKMEENRTIVAQRKEM